MSLTVAKIYNTKFPAILDKVEIQDSTKNQVLQIDVPVNKSGAVNLATLAELVNTKAEVLVLRPLDKHPSPGIWKDDLEKVLKQFPNITQIYSTCTMLMKPLKENNRNGAYKAIYNSTCLDNKHIYFAKEITVA